jgi:hypothetical protein
MVLLLMSIDGDWPYLLGPAEWVPSGGRGNVQSLKHCVLDGRQDDELSIGRSCHLVHLSL